MDKDDPAKVIRTDHHPLLEANRKVAQLHLIPWKPTSYPCQDSEAALVATGLRGGHHLAGAALNRSGLSGPSRLATSLAGPSQCGERLIGGGEQSDGFRL